LGQISMRLLFFILLVASTVVADPIAIR